MAMQTNSNSKYGCLLLSLTFITLLKCPTAQSEKLKCYDCSTLDEKSCSKTELGKVTECSEPDPQCFTVVYDNSKSANDSSGNPVWRGCWSGSYIKSEGFNNKAHCGPTLTPFKLGSKDNGKKSMARICTCKEDECNDWGIGGAAKMMTPSVRHWVLGGVMLLFVKSTVIEG